MHPRGDLALELVWAQLASQGAHNMEATLGWCYLTEELADSAQAILASLRERLPHVAWVGAVGAGVLATGVEYIDEPALAVMLCNMPMSDFRVFHGRQPLAPNHPLAAREGMWRAHTALVHADGHSPDLPELIQELADRTDTGYLFGGVSAGQSQSLHMAMDPHAQVHGEPDAPPPSGIWHGGLSGVAFNDHVRVVSRVTQGCEPIGPRREVTAAHRNVVYELDGLPALNCLLKDLGVPVTVPRESVVSVGGYWQPKYSVPNVRMVEAVQMLARTEGIPLDPVYTGKIMAGLIGCVPVGLVAAWLR